MNQKTVTRHSLLLVVMLVSFGGFVGCDPPEDGDSDASDSTAPDCSLVECASPSVVFVNSAAEPGKDGSSWQSALTSVGEAVALAARDAQTCCATQVWVQAGHYYVYEDNAENSITMQPWVDIYGGFAGTETDVTQRDFEKNITVLDGHQFLESPNQVNHVLRAADYSTLDGFVVTGGRSLKNAQSGYWLKGTALLMVDASPLIRNCVFAQNGLSGMEYSSAGVVHGDNSSAVLENCILTSNTGHQGMSADSSSITLRQVVFANNYLHEGWMNKLHGESWKLSGVTTLSGEMLLMDVKDVIIENSIGWELETSWAAGFFHTGEGVMSVERSTFTLMDEGDGSNNVALSTNGTLNVRNSIIWGPESASSIARSGTVDVQYSDALEWNGGTGNIAPVADPMFKGNISGEITLASVSYNPETIQTVLTATPEEPFETNRFKGLFIARMLRAETTDESDEETYMPQRWSYVAANTPTEIILWGDQTWMFRRNYIVAVYDPGLSEGSPCIDAADSATIPPTDHLGVAPKDSPAHENTGIGPPWGDMGALEFQ